MAETLAVKHGITSDAGLLTYRELDDALGLTTTPAGALAEGRHGKNIRHRLLGLLRQAWVRVTIDDDRHRWHGQGIVFGVLLSMPIWLAAGLLVAIL